MQLQKRQNKRLYDSDVVGSDSSDDKINEKIIIVTPASEISAQGVETERPSYTTKNDDNNDDERCFVGAHLKAATLLPPPTTEMKCRSTEKTKPNPEPMLSVR